MKKLFCLLCAIIMLFSLCACKDNRTPNTSEHTSTTTTEHTSTKDTEYAPTNTTATKASVGDFLALLEDVVPSGLISGYEIREENCYDVTPAEVAAETDMKIFKFSDSCASFVMVDGEIYFLCESFGGYGFVNALPCDFDKDGNKDLLVASSWGSGMHRSIISVFNSVTKESSVLYDTSTTDTPGVNLIVTQSNASLFTGNPEIDEKLYYSVLSVKINVENNNFATLSYVIDGIEGHIEISDDGPVFKPYKQ